MSFYDDANYNIMNKPRRAIRCALQAEIVGFGGFTCTLTDIRTDGQINGWTDGQTLIYRCEDTSTMEN